MGELLAPVVALDVDGTLSAEPWPDSSMPGGFTEHPVVIPAGMVLSAFVRGGGRADTPVIVRINANRRGTWIRALLDRGVEVVWSTTWELAANVFVAPLLGIPALPVACVAARDDITFGEMKTGPRDWKLRTLKRPYAGRPLYWIDDSALGFALEPIYEHAAPSLVIAPRPQLGLGIHDMRRVDRWLESL